MVAFLLQSNIALLLSMEVLSKVSAQGFPFLLEPRGFACACSASKPVLCYFRRELLVVPVSFLSMGFSSCTAGFIWGQSNNSARCLKMRFCLGGLNFWLQFIVSNSVLSFLPRLEMNEGNL